ncbi:hypothetical protein LTR70_009612 [Exophiala xenobiotica]|uniref:Uncharacterized protein n=1 Tax=Lithohypha guttulata TaxID=1690604 RepID=A0ABR0JWS9_9EURO|nr:hypothetical protein LTR24_009514 [Lithohypha guttulata]KAK5310272.1 hypothetical protein LTR70_009612 [Exophiala xenobiotica]
MTPRSPTSFSHFNFNGIRRRSSIDRYQEDSNGKEVRFEEPTASSSMHGRHSIATSHVPLLPPVSSSSPIPRQAFRITNPTPEVDLTAYFVQCRSLNEQLRKTHEEERKTWEIERTALHTRIADLEFRLNKANGGRRRRLSNDHTGARPSKPDFHVPFTSGAMNGVRHHGNTISTDPIEHLKHHDGRPIWEPESPVPATRVFSHDEDVQHLPSISEDGPLQDLSLQTSHENMPIPIQHIDETLDGIIVRPQGVRSSFSKIMSPIVVTSPARSPSPAKQAAEPPVLHLNASSLLDPLDTKLTRYAGHTPLAFDGPISSNVTTEGEPTPREEGPVAPLSSTRPPLRPSENSDSYFSTNNIHDIPEEATEEVGERTPQLEPADDPALTGPLMLDASGKSEASHHFLEELDHKLYDEVRKSMSNSPALSPARTAESSKTDDDNIPRLRLKKSTNFGSAFGVSAPRLGDR